ncbi:MAG TPA: anti-sigma factor [Candidatus Eisenbacteria bacterium]
MTAHREEYLDLCAAVLAGSVDEADRLELERHLAGGCPACERALAEMSHGIESLAAAAPPRMPSPRVRERVLSVVRAEAEAAGGRARPASAAARRVIELPSRPRRAWPEWALAVAAAILAVATFAYWRQASVLDGQLRGARERIAQVARELAEERAWAAVPASPGARVADLAPLPSGVTLPRVRAIYDPGSRRAIIAFDGLVTPPGADFELWAVLPDGPRSLGVVRADPSGHAEVRVPDAGEPALLSAFAVSLEHEGGSTNPRKPGGPVVLAGTLKS